MVDDGCWQVACRLSDLPVGRGWPVALGGRRLAVFCADGRLFAVDNECRHNGNPIDDGFVDDGCITCPWHGWRYDLATGEHLTLVGKEPGLQTYPVLLRDGTVFVDLQAAAEPLGGKDGGRRSKPDDS